jgi:hypothetical protein
MKKALTLMLAVFVILQLSACKVTIEKEMALGGDVNDIVAISIYEVEGEEYIGSEADDSVLDIRSECEPICVLEGEEIAAFVGELLALEYARDEIFPLHVDYAHLFAPGYVVFIEYSCTGCDVYAEKGIYTHSHYDGGIRYSYSHDDCRSAGAFDELIEKYITDRK